MMRLETANDILDFIKEVEIKFKPQHWKFNDIDIWPILRVSLYYELSMSSNGFKLNKPSMYQKIRRVASIIPPILFPKKAGSDLLLVSDGISYISLNESLYERFCDPILETALASNTNLSWAKWDLLTKLNGKFIFKSSKIASVLDYILIRDKFTKSEVKLTDWEEIFEFCQFVNSASFGRLNWSLKYVEKKLQSIDAMVSFFVKRLTSLKPKLTVIVSFYSDRAMALIYACDKLKIVTADIQHGVQGELHAAYSSWLAVPARGYNTLPDHFLVWSKSEEQAIIEWSKDSKKHSVRVIGNLFQEKWFSNADFLIKQIDREVANVVKNMKAEKHVLFTVQYSTHYEDWVFHLIAKTQRQFNWLIRLHPLMKDPQSLKNVENKLRQFKITNYELVKSTALPLYGLLRSVNIHITHSSSVVIEALNFQIKSILLSHYGAELFESQIIEGKAHLLTDSEPKSVKVMMEFISECFKEREIDKFDNSEFNTSASNYLKQYL